MSIQFTTDTMRDALTKTLDNYVAKGIRKHVSMNMNDFEDVPNSVDFIKDEFNEIKAQEMLIQFVDFAASRLKHDSPTTGDIVMGLSKMTPFVYDCETTLPQVIKEAVIIDFVNFAGVCCGMDLAMYTSDLSKEVGN